jgi:hypothetical protein
MHFCQRRIAPLDMRPHGPNQTAATQTSAWKATCATLFVHLCVLHSQQRMLSVQCNDEHMPSMRAPPHSALRLTKSSPGNWPIPHHLPQMKAQEELVARAAAGNAQCHLVFRALQRLEVCRQPGGWESRKQNRRAWSHCRSPRLKRMATHAW